MPGLSDLVQNFPHPTVVEEETAALFHSVSLSVLFPFRPLNSKS